MGIFDEKKYKIEEVHNTIVPIKKVNDNFIIDNSNVNTNCKNISKKKVYNYETDWIDLDTLVISSWTTLYTSAGHRFDLYDGDTGILHTNVAGDIGIVKYFPQLLAAKDYSMRTYSKLITIQTNIPTEFRPFITYKVIFKTDEIYQNKLIWGRMWYYCFSRICPPSCINNSLGYFTGRVAAYPIILMNFNNGLYTFRISATYQGDGVLTGTLRTRDVFTIPPIDETIDLYAPPLITVQGKIMMSIFNPR